MQRYGAWRIFLIGCLLASGALWAKPPKPAAQSSPAPFTREDLQWLSRVTYGLNTETLLTYQQLGRAAFLAKEIQGGKDEQLPTALQLALQSASSNASGDPGNKPLAQVMREIDQENRRINALGDEEQKQAARRALNETGNQATYEASRRIWFLVEPLQRVSEQGQVALVGG